MNRRLPSSVHVEHLLISRCEGGAMTSLPLVVSDNPELLARLHGGLGPDNFSPLEWGFSVLCDPLQLEVVGYFNRAGGWRLRESLRTSIGKQWHWLPPRRTRRLDTVSGHAGCVRIPVTRLWLAWDEGLPEPASVESLARLKSFLGWYERLGFCNDGLVSIDVSRIRGIDRLQRKAMPVSIVEQLLRVPDIWSIVGKYEGHFVIRIGGRLRKLLDVNIPFEAKWNLRHEETSRYVAAARPFEGQNWCDA